jgi:tetrahydromethanopterin S-methyltransferase subunit G
MNMDQHSQEFETLLELDHRHDELLERLDELDKRIEHVLAQWLSDRKPSSAAA